MGAESPRSRSRRLRSAAVRDALPAPRAVGRASRPECPSRPLHALPVAWARDAHHRGNPGRAAHRGAAEGNAPHHRPRPRGDLQPPRPREAAPRRLGARCVRWLRGARPRGALARGDARRVRRVEPRGCRGDPRQRGGPRASRRSTEVARDKVLPWLARSTRPVDLANFDVALLDPPYDLAPTELAATLAALVPRLTPGAAVVVEWSSRGAAPTWPGRLSPVASKKYGETTVHYAVVTGEDSPVEPTPPSGDLGTSDRLSA